MKTIVHQYVNGQPPGRGSRLEPWMTSLVDHITKTTAVRIVSIHIDKHSDGGGAVHVIWGKK